MDDIAGLSWPSGPSAANGNGNGKPAGRPNVPYPSLTPSPGPGSNQGFNRPNPGALGVQGSLTQSKPTSRTSTPSNDSFSNLVNFGSSKDGANLTLVERQKRMAEERSRKEAEQKQNQSTQFSASDNAFWDSLDQTKQKMDSTSKAKPLEQSLGPTGSKSLSNAESQAAEDDLLHAFSAKASVNTSSHFPPATSSISTPAEAELGDDPDDPFGLGSLEKRGRPEQKPQLEDDDDDLLGALGKPVESFRSEQRQKASRASPDLNSKNGTSEQEKALVELVDMGFSAEKAQEALASTQTGADVQAAVGWLLDAAHREAKQQRQNSSGPRRRETGDEGLPSESERSASDAMPAWMRETGSTSASGRQSKNPSANAGEKDITQAATEIGATLFKSANTIWKTGKKKVQKAVTELQQDGNPSQPKWMIDAQRHQMPGDNSTIAPEQRQSALGDRRASKSNTPPTNVTEEALMLEGDHPRTRTREKPRTREPQEPVFTHQSETPREQVMPASRTLEASRRQFQQTTVTVSRSPHNSHPKSSLTKTVIEEQSAQAYVSPARRKKPSPRPAETKHQEPSTAPAALQSTRTESTRPSKTPSSAVRQPVSLPARPKPPTRVIPAVSPAVLSSSATNRQKGSESFKRGDYSGAHTFYSSALSGLPSEHPITIVILCNRSLVNLKNGDPKAAVADAEAALRVIGPSQGDGETITLHDGDGDHPKNMRDFFSKAMIRRAEGLEQMEKWSEAATAWRDAVEVGAGGATSIQARDRCERAAGKKSTSTPTPQAAARRPTTAAATKPTSSTKSAAATVKPRQPPRPTTSDAAPTARSNEAVQKLRQANQAAERTDEEKFALADHVDARLAAWKEGKQDNIRALLVSLDTVLWPEAGWKKVGMHELVMANKVKVVYMKGIAKVHPDKVRSVFLP